MLGALAVLGAGRATVASGSVESLVHTENSGCSQAQRKLSNALSLPVERGAVRRLRQVMEGHRLTRRLDPLLEPQMRDPEPRT